MTSVIGKVAIVLIVVTLLLLTVGVVMLFSTSAVYAQERYGDSYYFLKRQIMWLLLGTVACCLTASIHYPKLRGVSGVLLALALVLLVLVLIPGIGLKINGARRWMGVGQFRFQPSEFAKFALMIALAHLLARDQRRMKQFTRGFLAPMAVTAPFLLLILLEPDFGTTALLAMAAFALMFVAGARLRYLLPTIGTGLIAFFAYTANDPHRLRRLMAFVDLEQHKATAGYQVWQAMLAFGSGGVSGLGLGNSRQKMFYLPEAHTDFIFPIVGEELGLIVTLAIVIGFLILAACGVYISLKAPDTFGTFLGLGMVFLISFQAIINIGVVTAWLPTKGLPLPFISFGGSNLVVNMAAIGLLINIYRHAAGELRTDEHEFFARRTATV